MKKQILLLSVVMMTKCFSSDVKNYTQEEKQLFVFKYCSNIDQENKESAPYQGADFVSQVLLKKNFVQIISQPRPLMNLSTEQELSIVMDLSTIIAQQDDAKKTMYTQFLVPLYTKTYEEKYGSLVTNPRESMQQNEQSSNKEEKSYKFCSIS